MMNMRTKLQLPSFTYFKVLKFKSGSLPLSLLTSDDAPFWVFVTYRLGLAMANLCTKVEVYSFTRSEYKKDDPKLTKYR